MLWTSPGRYEAVLMASGFIFYRRVPEMIRIPFPSEAELAKAVRQDSDAQVSAEESAHGESGC
ncbi:hypothetical protein AB0B45_02765 [Nonomuraea sp. NPDC049152]|uniref:hypothetical protein n=1 Tax=Nonomuraea sp. NPDC049152 TaxID=3154350 RepID=UPI0033D681D5